MSNRSFLYRKIKCLTIPAASLVLCEMPAGAQGKERLREAMQCGKKVDG